MKSPLASETRTRSALPGESCVSQLAQVFSEVTPLRIPVRVTALRKRGRIRKENVVIEFGTASEVLFACALPVEFDDRVRLENSDGSFDVEACVVAVRYHEGRRAVAARFASKVVNWLIQR